LILRREVGDKVSLAQSVGSLAQVAFLEGDYRTAQTLYEQCVALKKELGDKWGLAIALGNLASVLLMRQDYRVARSYFEQCISLAREIGDKVTAAVNLGGLGAVAVRSGPSAQAERGVRLLGASDALLEALGAVREADDRIPYDNAALIARAQLGGEAFERACREGRAMSIEEALEYAHHTGEGPSQAPDA
jgi:tetratricopeptide (TPR) repeat protein